MKRKSVFLNALVFLIVPILITIAQYYANVLAMPLFRRFDIPVSPTELLLYEGILFLIVGFLTLLGIRGAGSEDAVKIVVLTKTIYGDNKTVGPSRIFRDYWWNPKGYPRVALVLIITGVLMVLTYFFEYHVFNQI